MTKRDLFETERRKVGFFLHGDSYRPAADALTLNPPKGMRFDDPMRWRRWLSPEHRCLVPANAFSEYAPKPDPKTGKKPLVWFATDKDMPLFAFAGLWTNWKSVRKVKEGEGRPISLAS